MSADRIDGHCPKCGANRLQEYTDMAMSFIGNLEIAYSCRCYECGFSWRFNYSVPVKDAVQLVQS